MQFDAIVIGSGPNGLAAAIRMAQAGRKVLVLERNSTIGGGARSGELIEPGHLHDRCSAVHPLGLASPFFRRLPLEAHGLEWLHAEVPLAHPFDDGSAATLMRSVEDTARSLGRDAQAWQKLMGPLARDWEKLLPDILAPLHPPRHPLLLANFGLKAVRSARSLSHSRFSTPQARGFFAGLAAHSVLPLNYPASAAIALMLGVAGHAVGWPIPKGGAQRISNALAAYFSSLGGEIRTDCEIRDVRDLPSARCVFFNLSPKQLLDITGERLPALFRKRLRSFHYGPASFKMDWILSEPVPWKSEACRKAGTVHLGGTFEEIARSEQQPWNGAPPERPFVLVAQPTLLDATRAPAGRHILWAYCHLPNRSGFDMSDRIEQQIERFAPGFKETILSRRVTDPAGIEAHNPNCVGGDISSGAPLLSQLLTRPVVKLDPYALPVKGWYLCSSSTPPGPGVHGMCGYHAAEAALKNGF